MTCTNPQETSKARSFLTSKVEEILSPTVPNVTTEMELNTQHVSPMAMSNDPNKQLERIRIPMFTGNKVEFQQWFAAFSTCIDKTLLAPEYKMLRLERCLRGEAAETIKGLGYTQAAYDAAKAKLQRKYGGDRRKVQAQIDELRKLKTVTEGDPKSMDKFADILEKTVMVFKDNSLQADLGGV